jgi:hypothetical protein
VGCRGFARVLVRLFLIAGRAGLSSPLETLRQAPLPSQLAPGRFTPLPLMPRGTRQSAAEPAHAVAGNAPYRICLPRGYAVRPQLMDAAHGQGAEFFAA